MNRLSSQPKTQPSQGRMTPMEYMIHKNIPIPNKAKTINPDTPALQHQSTIVLMPTLQQNSNDQLKRLLEERNKEIEFLKQTENQSRLFSNQFQELNENHQQETKQLLDQISNYKQRTNDLKSQLEQYIQELNKNTIKYQECCKERDEYLKNFREYQSEYDLLRMQLQNKETEIITLKDRITQIESQHHQEIKQQSQTSEQWKRSVLDSQVREMTQQYNQDRIQFEIKLRNYETKNTELENKCVLLAQELERVRISDQNKNNTKINSLLQENEQLKNQLQEMLQFIQEYEQQHNVVDEQQEQQMLERMRIVVLNSEIERLWLLITDSENKKQQQIETISQQNNLQIQQIKQQYSTQLHQYEEDIWHLQQEQNNWNKAQIELKNQCAMLTIEIERLNLVMRENEQSNQILQSQLNQFKINSQNYEQQLIQLEAENSNYQQESLLLNAENEHLQLKIQQLNDEIQTIQMSSQQIATRRSLELKQQLDQYTSELNRTQSNYNALSQEHDDLQQEYQNLLRQIDMQQLQINEQQENLQNIQEQMQLMETKHKIETDELRKQGEFQRRSLLDSQIRELTQKFNNDKQQLENQIRAISQQKLQVESRCQYLQQELDKLPFAIEEQVDIQKQRLQASEKERINLLSEIKDYQSQLQYFVADKQTFGETIIKERMKIIIYATEIERLWHVIDDFTTNCKDLEEQQQLQNNKIQQLTNTLQQYQNKICSIEQEKQTLEQGKQILEQEKQNLEFNYQQLENKLILISSELERTKNQLYEEQSKEYEFEIKQKQLMSEIEELYTQIESYQTDITEMQKSGLELSDLETKFQAQTMAWDTQRYQLNNQIKDYEQKIYVITQELRRITMIAEDRLHELEELRLNIRDSQLNERYEQLQEQYEQLEQQLMDLEQTNLKLKSTNHTLESQVRLLEQTVQDKSKEVEETYNLMNRQRKQSEYSNREADVNRKNQQQYLQQINVLEQQNQTLKDQLITTSNEHQNLIQQVEYMQKCLSERDMMIQKKTNELNEKIKEMDALKIKYEQKLNTSTSSTIRTSSITRQIVRTEQENIINESMFKSKQISSIIARPPRQVMSQLENQQE